MSTPPHLWPASTGASSAAAVASVASGPVATDELPSAADAPRVGPGVHLTVLRDEAVQALAPAGAEGVYLDGTFGRGGHSRALLARLGAGARLVGFDKDPEALAVGQELAAEDPRFAIVHASFAAMAEVLAERGLGRPGAGGAGVVDGVLLDLGVSSPQIDNPLRGFSFRADAPLDMRMDPTQGETAADFLAQASTERIAEVLRDYGEERFAPAIARAIVARREAGRPVATTAELAAVAAGAVRTREPGKDPATRTFQALRIQVNRELQDLQDGLEAALALLKPGGRLAVISFHSLEDRCVKQFIARESRADYDRRVPFAPSTPTRLRAVARTMPGEAEVAANPRARSAVLRVAERTEVPFEMGRTSRPAAPAGHGARRNAARGARC